MVATEDRGGGAGDKMSRPKTTAANPLCNLHRKDDGDDDDEEDEEDIVDNDVAPKFESRCNRDVPPNFMGAIVTILLPLLLLLYIFSISMHSVACTP